MLGERKLIEALKKKYLSGENGSNVVSKENLDKFLEEAEMLYPELYLDPPDPDDAYKAKQKELDSAFFFMVAAGTGIILLTALLCYLCIICIDYGVKKIMNRQSAADERPVHQGPPPGGLVIRRDNNWFRDYWRRNPQNLMLLENDGCFIRNGGFIIPRPTNDASGPMPHPYAPLKLPVHRNAMMIHALDPPLPNYTVCQAERGGRPYCRSSCVDEELSLLNLNLECLLIELGKIEAEIERREKQIKEEKLQDEEGIIEDNMELISFEDLESRLRQLNNQWNILSGNLECVFKLIKRFKEDKDR